MKELVLMDRMISLSIGTVGAEEWMQVFQDISELARGLGSDRYVSVSSTPIDDIPEDPPETEDELYYDEFTLGKVRAALLEAAGPYGHSEMYVDDLIHAMQNAGILFRERPKSKEEPMVSGHTIQEADHVGYSDVNQASS
jgi:hypothetical protein